MKVNFAIFQTSFEHTTGWIGLSDPTVFSRLYTGARKTGHETGNGHLLVFGCASRAIRRQRLFKVFRLYFQETPCGSVAHDRTTRRTLLPYFVSIWAPYYRLQSAVEIGSVSPECKLSRDALCPGGRIQTQNQQARKSITQWIPLL